MKHRLKKKKRKENTESFVVDPSLDAFFLFFFFFDLSKILFSIKSKIANLILADIL